jgi:hypothetical protein
MPFPANSDPCDGLSQKAFQAVGCCTVAPCRGTQRRAAPSPEGFWREGPSGILVGWLEGPRRE